MSLLGRILILAAMAAASGCAKKTAVSDHNPALGEGLAAAEAQRVTAQGNVKAAKPHTNRTGKALLDRADVTLDEQGTSIRESQGALAKANTERLAMNDALLRRDVQIEGLVATVKQEQSQWVGDRTWRTLRWVVGLVLAAWALLGVAGMLLSGFFGATGVGWLGGHVLKLLPFANPFYFLRNWIRSRENRSEVTATTTVVNVGSAPASAVEPGNTGG